ncbi:transcription factor FAMA isoform X2 [Olea europaea subsp. europaea]|uniref:Transcription factor FAMA isoform X2 n=1 Tax=Olea europaea subsp. europaea TaxID=158383 RepID=A0A8S0UHR9_OLEEU|nr:transcription factor FAMA isoform X2 [Olea europaea subsp. europaea]
MEKEGNYSATGNYPAIDYSIENHHQQQQIMRPEIGETSADNTCQMVDYMINNHPLQSSNFCGSTSLDKLSFADVMQLADFGPKLALNQARTSDDRETAGGIDPVYFLKFPVLNERLQDDQSLLGEAQALGDNQESNGKAVEEGGEDMFEENNSVQLRFLGKNLEKNPVTESIKNKRKRPRTIKTSEEVESQRMTHIAVERNRRKQMNEHLRVLRSLMPGSYVQRGDQASIIGGAIEFVRELEQLLQCLESQKRRRLYGDGQRPIGDPSLVVQQQQPQPQFLIPPVPNPLNDQVRLVEHETGLHEETAESKSYLADVEVKVLGFDALIKILSRRRPGQLIKAIAALEDLQLNILHTNITTIEQTVLYSFNVKITAEARFTAEDIANSVQQIFSFIHAESNT